MIAKCFVYSPSIYMHLSNVYALTYKVVSSYKVLLLTN